MIEPEDTTWTAEPHTLAKHNVFVSYLQAWAAIMSQHLTSHGGPPRPLRVVDGFAGPGKYDNEKDGSPVLALKAILDHTLDLRIPITFDFIETRHDRYGSLVECVNELEPRWRANNRIASVRCHNSPCDEVIGAWLDEYDSQQKPFGPAFCFLDQFGYSNVPLRLIKRILSHPMCETFSYLSWSQMNHYLTDKTKWSAITRAFGDEQWRGVFDVPSDQKARFMQLQYKRSLTDGAGARYVWHMAMCNAQEQLSHWLFFCTNNDRGLEEMKKAMLRVDPSGDFRFSDRDDPNQYRLLNSYDEASLENDLSSKFAGQTVAVHDVKMYVLTETPVVKFKETLKQLELRDGITPLNAPPNRRRGTFADESMRLRFKSTNK